MIKRLFSLALFAFGVSTLSAQGVAASSTYVKEMTSNWKGERFDDGRPKVSDALLKRLKNIQVEEAWGYLKNKGYNNQYDGNWKILHLIK